MLLNYKSVLLSLIGYGLRKWNEVNLLDYIMNGALLKKAIKNLSGYTKKPDETTLKRLLEDSK